jgi:hypothetical protein
VPDVHLDERTVRRLDALRTGDQSYDDVVATLCNVAETQELALRHGSADRRGGE